MGMSKEVYVGAFLVVKANRIIDKEKRWVCEDHLNWQVLDKDKYCSICGKKLAWKMVEDAPRTSGLYDLLPEQKYEDVLLQLEDLDDEKQDKIIVIGNLRTDPELPDCVELDDTGLVLITDDMSVLYLENFQRMYADVIRILEERTRSVVIKFGLLVYYN